MALYALGVFVVAAITTPIFLVLIVLITTSRSNSLGLIERTLDHPQQFIHSPTGQVTMGSVLCFTMIVIVSASSYRLRELRGGGQVVARGVGASLVDGHTTNPLERRLLNVVEEMAVAAGVPVPPVYVLRNENSINAFAAGYASSDAVIVVTAGALRYLPREQLQGVIAHEFSHILNGDMRLNIRMLALLFGIGAIGLLGRILMEGIRDSKGGGLFFFIGLLLVIIGAAGTAVAALIRAAVSREREFLADASAVEFTRNPVGLAGALKTIGGFPLRGSMLEARTAECSHMFFTQGDEGPWASLAATHPPLESRIIRLDPAWDGAWPKIEPIPEAAAEVEADLRRRAERAARLNPIVPAVAVAAVAPIPGAWTPAEVLDEIKRARGTLDELDPQLLRAARDACDARSLVLALLLSRKSDVAQTQLNAIGSTLGQAARTQTERLSAALSAGGKDSRLPLALLALGTLASLSPDQYQALRRTMEQVLAANPRMDLFKLCMQRMIAAHLDRRHGGDARPVVQYYALGKLGEECSVLLSAVAEAGKVNGADGGSVNVAIRRATDPLRIATLRRVPADGLTADAINNALTALAQASTPLKRRVVEACAAVAGVDGVLQPEERELVSAIADALQVPLV